MNEIATILNHDGIGVLATDTLYGIVGRALSPRAVQRVYDARCRNPAKPCIILLADRSQLQLFGINPAPVIDQQIEAYWPGPVSIIMPCPNDNLSYLHRGTRTLAFRVPAKATLRQLLRQTGPLIAPSANLEGQPPATTLAEARAYFGNACEFYRRGITTTRPSKLIAVVGNKINILRP